MGKQSYSWKRITAIIVGLVCVSAILIIILKVYREEINEIAGKKITLDVDVEDNVAALPTRTVDCTVYRAKTNVCLRWEAAMRELAPDYEFMSPGSHAVVEMYFLAMQKKEEMIEAYRKCMENEAHKVTIGLPGHLYKIYSKGMDKELFEKMFVQFTRELFEAGNNPTTEN